MEREYNPYNGEQTKTVNQKFTQQYRTLCHVVSHYNKDIEPLMLWRIANGNSWKNNWSVKRSKRQKPLNYQRYQPNQTNGTAINLK